MIFVRNAIMTINYAKESNDEDFAISEKSNINAIIIASKSLINQSFDIFSSSASFFFYINHIQS